MILKLVEKDYIPVGYPNAIKVMTNNIANPNNTNALTTVNALLLILLLFFLWVQKYTIINAMAIIKYISMSLIVMIVTGFCIKAFFFF